MTDMPMRHLDRKTTLFGLLAVAGLMVAIMTGIATPAYASESGTYTINKGILMEKKAIVWEGEVTVTGGPLGVGVECEEKAEGYANEFGEARFGSMTFSNCEFQKYGECERTHEPKIETALHLEWITALTSGSENTIGYGSKERPPGFKLSCHILGLGLTMECLANTTMRTSMTNTSTGVATVFNGTEPLSCKTGEYSGTATVSGHGEMRTTIAGDVLGVASD